MEKRARVIAFYLPQYHPIPENDKWWGKGFTEWTNVGKAKPLFHGHYQPRVPADLGYYDLRLPEVREAQAELAREAGIEGFMYWHYWFGGGRTIMEFPLRKVLEMKKPDFPFCLGWANHSWYNWNWNTNDQHKSLNVLIEQQYLGESDYRLHFEHIKEAFLDSRYLKINDKPIFFIYSPLSFPDINNFITSWQRLAIQEGLKGIHFIGQANRDIDCDRILKLGFDAICRSGVLDAQDKIKGRMYNYLMDKIKNTFRFSNLITPLVKYDYSEIIKYIPNDKLDKQLNIYPIIIPNYDHTPRSGKRGTLFYNSSPQLFKKHILKALDSVKEKPDEDRIVFIRSWNEWAEGNYVEPDLVFGHGYLDAIREAIMP